MDSFYRKLVKDINSSIDFCIHKTPKVINFFYSKSFHIYYRKFIMTNYRKKLGDHDYVAKEREMNSYQT